MERGGRSTAETHTQRGDKGQVGSHTEWARKHMATLCTEEEDMRGGDKKLTGRQGHGGAVH